MRTTQTTVPGGSVRLQLYSAILFTIHPSAARTGGLWPGGDGGRRRSQHREDSRGAALGRPAPQQHSPVLAGRRQPLPRPPLALLRPRRNANSAHQLMQCTEAAAC